MVQALKEAAVGYGRSWQTTAAVVLLLGLGVGANTASISVAISAIRNPIGVDDPDRLVLLDGAFLSTSGDWPPTAPVLDYAKHLRTFAGLAAYSIHEGGVNLRTDAETVRARGAEVSSTFFTTMGVAVPHGRAFTQDERVSGRNRVVVIGDALWRRAFGAAPDAVGRSVILNGVPFTVVGIAEPRFRFPRDADFWIPISWGSDRVFTGPATAYAVFGRLRKGVSLAAVSADLNSLREGMKTEAPASWLARDEIKAVSLSEHLVSRARLSLVVLVIATTLVWAVAAANASSLLASRALGRSKELAIRMALGASPGRLGARFLAEALLLAVLGGLSGLICAGVALRVVEGSMPTDFPQVSPTNVLPLVLVVGVGLALLTGLVSVVPGLVQVFVRRADWLRSFGMGAQATGAEPARMSGLLVVCQIALAFVLVAGALGLGRTFTALQRVDIGFRSSGLMTMSVSLPPTRYPSRMARVGFFDEVLRRTRALPKVQDAEATNALPFGKNDTIERLVTAVGRPAPKDFADRFAVDVYVTSGYLRTLGVSILEGRHFTPEDREGSTPVAVVDEVFARRFFGAVRAVGQRLEIAGAGAPVQIVGVVANMRDSSLTSPPEPHLYRPEAQAGVLTSFVLRSEAGTAELLPVLRSIIRSVDPEVAVYQAGSMDQLVQAASARERLLTSVMSGFGAIAVFLSAIGVYAAMSAHVLRRRHEIGVRMALGATPKDIISLVVGRGSRLLVLGVLCGALLAAGLWRTLEAVQGLGVPDPLLYGIGGSIIGLACTAACLKPAHTALGSDPLRVLRSD